MALERIARLKGIAHVLKAKAAAEKEKGEGGKSGSVSAIAAPPTSASEKRAEEGGSAWTGNPLLDKVPVLRGESGSGNGSGAKEPDSPEDSPIPAGLKRKERPRGKGLQAEGSHYGRFMSSRTTITTSGRELDVGKEDGEGSGGKEDGGEEGGVELAPVSPPAATRKMTPGGMARLTRALSGTRQGMAMRFTAKLRAKRKKRVAGDAVHLSDDHGPRFGREQKPIPRGIPLREILQHLYNVKRERTIREACCFLLFGVLFAIVVLSILDVNTAFQTNDALVDLFLDEEFTQATYKKNFFEVMTMEEMWTWLREPLVNGAYPTETYNGVPIPEGEDVFMLQVLRRVGGVQLRQLRVRPDSCDSKQFKGEPAVTLHGKCYASFSFQDQEKRPFGPNNQFKWSSDHHHLSGLYGFGGNYGTGGYIETLPVTNHTLAMDKLNELHDAGWTGPATRAVAVMFNAYNAQTKLLTVVRVLFEFFDSGHVIKSYRMLPMRILLYDTLYDWIRALGEAAVVGATTLFVYGELRKLGAIRSFVRYIGDPATTFEVIVNFLIFTAVFYYFSYIINPQRVNFSVNEDEFVDLFATAENFVYVFTLTGFVGLLLIAKLFRYLSISKRMIALWLTLGRAAPDLIAFGVGFSLLIAGFSFLAHMLYGTMFEDFHSLGASFSTLLRYPMGGDVNYNSLSMIRPLVTPWFFFFYLAMVLLLSFNMLIAMINMFFEEVSLELRSADPWKRNMPSWESRIEGEVQLLRRETIQWCRARNCCTRNTTMPALRHLSSLRRINSEDDASSPSRRSSFVGGDARMPRQSMDEAARPYIAHRRALIQHRAEQRFRSALESVIDHCFENNGVDLFDYVEKLYHDREGTENMYIGLSELQKLVRPREDVGKQRCLDRMGRTIRTMEVWCSGTCCCCTCCCSCCARNSLDSNEAAAALLAAYGKLKHVILLGNVVRHDDKQVYAKVVPRMSGVFSTGRAGADFALEDVANTLERPMEEADTRRFYVVHKINRHGVHQLRQLAIDTRRNGRTIIMSYDRLGRLKRRIPLTQLVQLEKSEVDPRLLTMIFVGKDEFQIAEEKELASGGSGRKSNASDGSEDDRVYHARFERQADGTCEREIFTEALVSAHKQMLIDLRAKASDSGATPPSPPPRLNRYSSPGSASSHLSS